MSVRTYVSVIMSSVNGYISTGDIYCYCHALSTSVVFTVTTLLVQYSQCHVGPTGDRWVGCNVTVQL